MTAGSGKSAANGADVDVQNFGDFFVGELLHFTHDQDRAVFLGQELQSSSHHRNAFLAEHRFIGRFVTVYWVTARDFAALVNRHFAAPAAPATECIVECDAIQPREKLAVSLKTTEF